jgi:hypothetical protein
VAANIQLALAVLAQRLSGIGCGDRSRKRRRRMKTFRARNHDAAARVVFGARQRPAAALSGSDSKAPGSAGEYLLSKNRSALRFAERGQVMAQCRILLAEDDPQVRSFVEATLKARE